MLHSGDKMVNIAIAIDAHQTSLLKPEHVVCLLQLPTGAQSWPSFVVAVFSVALECPLVQQFRYSRLKA